MLWSRGWGAPPALVGTLKRVEPLELADSRGGAGQGVSSARSSGGEPQRKWLPAPPLLPPSHACCFSSEHVQVLLTFPGPL